MIAGPALPLPAPSPVCPTSLDFDSFSSSFGEHIIPFHPSPQTRLPPLWSLVAATTTMDRAEYHKQVESPTTVAEPVELAYLFFSRRSAWGISSARLGAPPAAAVGASATETAAPLRVCYVRPFIARSLAPPFAVAFASALRLARFIM